MQTQSLGLEPRDPSFLPALRARSLAMDLMAMDPETGDVCVEVWHGAGHVPASMAQMTKRSNGRPVSDRLSAMPMVDFGSTELDQLIGREYRPQRMAP